MAYGQIGMIQVNDLVLLAFCRKGVVDNFL